MGFANAYADADRAATYATLEFPGTYYLAYRDLPEIVDAHVSGREAVDFGCGTGRSSRFLTGLGFVVVGLDISAAMLAHARSRDSQGDYRLVTEDAPLPLATRSRDLVLSMFTFDNIPAERKVDLFRELVRVLRPTGRIVNVVSSPELYVHDWESLTTTVFAENRRARVGDVVRTIITATGDARPVEDIYCPDEAYREVYAAAGLSVLGKYRPLATGAEPYAWVHETRIAPWVIYVLSPVPAA